MNLCPYFIVIKIKEISILLLLFLSYVTFLLMSIHIKPKIYYHKTVTARRKIVALLSAFDDAGKIK